MFEDHVWITSVSARTSKKKGLCPFCVNQRIWSKNNLSNLFQDIAKEWHSTKNGDLRPTQIGPGTSKSYWWQCPVAFDHVWKAAPKNRTGRGDGCQFCGKTPKLASSTNNLSIRNPNLAKRWHPTMNGELKPDHVLSSTGKKFW